MATCTICSNAAAKALLEGAVASGMLPSIAYRTHMVPLNISQAAMYRHLAKHLDTGPLTTTWLGDSRVGDVIADSASLARSFYEQRAKAIERNDHQTASREGAAALSAFTTLLREGIDSESIAEKLRYYDEIGASVWELALSSPDSVELLAKAAEKRHHRDLADDYRHVARNAAKYLEQMEKKK